MNWKNVQYKNGKCRTSEGGGGASNFADLEDVSFSNLQNGQVPKYNSTTQKWENEENSLANLSDTSMLTLSDKQVLSYNARTQKWENRSNSVSRLSDVSLNSPSDGDILRYNAQSGEWENVVMPDSYHVYSTSEQIVGEWIDGKPLYEKTIHKVNDVVFTNGLLINTGISNANVIFVYEAHFLDYGQNVFATLPYFQSPTNLQDYLSVGIDTSTNKIKVASNTSFSINANRYLDVTIRYTKTTD